MNKSDLILAQLANQLATIANTIPEVKVDTGFLAHYQDKLAQNEQVIVIQQLNDGPYDHRPNGGGQSTLNIVVGGLVAFNTDAMTKLRTLLSATRVALFNPEEDRHFKLNGLLSSPMIEAEPTPLITPQEGQENAYFALPLSLKYTES